MNDAYPYYLINATSMMATLLYRRDPDICEAAFIGCSTLKRLANEDAFLKMIRELEQEISIIEVKNIINNEVDFLKFLSIEKSLLEQAGVHSEVVITIHDLALRFAKDAPRLADIVKIRETLTPRSMHGLVERLRNQTCELSRVMDAKGDLEVKRQLLIDIAVGIGCLSSAAINFSPLAAQLGLNVILSQMSSFVSSAIFGELAWKINGSIEKYVKTSHHQKNTINGRI